MPKEIQIFIYKKKKIKFHVICLQTPNFPTYFDRRKYLRLDLNSLKHQKQQRAKFNNLTTTKKKSKLFRFVQKKFYLILQKQNKPHLLSSFQYLNFNLFIIEKVD